MLTHETRQNASKTSDLFYILLDFRSPSDSSRVKARQSSLSRWVATSREGRRVFATLAVFVANCVWARKNTNKFMFSCGGVVTLSGGVYSLLISLEITTLPPASFRGASAQTSFLLVSTSRHLAATDPSAMISWQVLPQCFREQRFKSYAGRQDLPQELPRASCFRKTFRMLPRAQRETHFGNHP